MFTYKYQNCEAEIKTLFYSMHSSVLTPVVRITSSPQKLILTTEYFPTREQAEQYGITMARKWIDQNDGKPKSLARRAA